MATAMVPRARGDARERDRERGRAVLRERGREGKGERERGEREREREDREREDRERVYGPIPANQDNEITCYRPERGPT